MLLFLQILTDVEGVIQIYIFFCGLYSLGFINLNNFCGHFKTKVLIPKHSRFMKLGQVMATKRKQKIQRREAKTLLYWKYHNRAQNHVNFLSWGWEGCGLLESSGLLLKTATESFMIYAFWAQILMTPTVNTVYLSKYQCQN